MPIARPVITPAAIALNRFGLGARPDEAVPADPHRWLIDQFSAFEPRPTGLAALADPAEILRRYQKKRRDLRQARGNLRSPSGVVDVAGSAARPDLPAPATDAPTTSIPDRKDTLREARQEARALYRAAVQARADGAVASEAPFVERLVHFWANHFAISADNIRVAVHAGAFERDAIRPHVLGRFEDMLLAVERHPAMLVYLNQVGSVGPDSPAAQRAGTRRRGLNENFAREIMELHTLGVRSGYAQADITEFARALTGWTVGRDAGTRGRFAFRPAQHQPGRRIILGRGYDQVGEAQARAALSDFCHDPRTAEHIATKLARHFAGDVPSQAMVRRLTDEFVRTRGDLPSVYRVLVRSPEAWAPASLKFKSPWEWTISAWRGLGLRTAPPRAVAALEQLGQPVWKPGSPAGWDDLDSTWAAPDALMRRVELAASMAAPQGDRVDARELGTRLMPGSLAPETLEQVARSESPAGALALLLASPDFLRR